MTTPSTSSSTTTTKDTSHQLSSTLPEATKYHSFECFTCLFVHLGGESNNEPTNTNNNNYPLLASPRVGGVFVTWTNTSDGSLRGCIGSLSEIDLLTGLRDYAIRAGTRDSRFSPITLKEFSKLTCGVSILGQFEDGYKWNEWIIGTHGIIIKLELDGVKYSATYLPEVAPSQEWNIKQTISSLLHKSGIDKRKINETMFDKISLTRYQSSKITATYSEWVAAVRQKKR
jgi:uncharacterized protein (TIGR00296 family)